MIGAAFALAITLAGFCVLRMLRLPARPLDAGLAAPAGLGLIIMSTSWLRWAGLPSWSGSLFLIGFAIVGLVQFWSPAGGSFGAVHPRERSAYAVLAVALGTGLTILGVAFGDLPVPLWTFDGAHHTELVQLLQRGDVWRGIYPSGLHGAFAAFLVLIPWVDLAHGTADAALGLTLLAILALYGLGGSLWNAPIVGAMGALVGSLTYQYSYSQQFFSTWPLMAGVILAVGVLTVIVRYLSHPAPEWSVLAAVLGAAIITTHTHEAYTVALGGSVFLVGLAARRTWRPLALHGPLALAIVVVLTLPYTRTLFGWAGGTALASRGYEGLSFSADTGVRLDLAMVDATLQSMSGGFLLDVPFRLGLLALGIAYALRSRQGRALVAAAGAFVGLSLLFTYSDAPPVRKLFAVTAYWGLADRMLIVPAGLASILQGLALARLLASFSDSPQGSRPLRGAREATKQGLILASLLLVIGMTAIVLMNRASLQMTYTPDDANAMAWLREHAAEDEVVANDWMADGGIWVPFKVGTSILVPRLSIDKVTAEQRLVLDNISSLDHVPEAELAACVLHVRYVYHGAVSPPDFGGQLSYLRRRFPPPSVLRQSNALEEVFSSGEAAVFRTKLRCSP